MFCRKDDLFEAIQYPFVEMDGEPLTFDELPVWLERAIELGQVKPFFKGDYWVLKIECSVCLPGDYIVYRYGSISFEDKLLFEAATRRVT